MTTTGQTRLKVIDALDHPHGGRILRLRLVDGEAPAAKALKGAKLSASGPRGETRDFRVLRFPLTYGKVSDARIRETGRIDVLVEEEGEGPPIDLQWEIEGP